MTRHTGLLLCLQLPLLTAVAPAQTRPRLDTTTFVVLGEGLAAGMADFGLTSVVQEKSFPAQMARQMGTCFIKLIWSPSPIIPGLTIKPHHMVLSVLTTSV